MKVTKAAISVHEGVEATGREDKVLQCGGKCLTLCYSSGMMGNYNSSFR